MNRTRPSLSLFARVSMAFALVMATPGPSRAQVRDSVETYPSGPRRVTLECFAPDRPGSFPAVLLLHGSGGLDPGTAMVFREMAANLAARGYVALIPHFFEATGHVVGRPFPDQEYAALLASVDDAMTFAARFPEVDPSRFAIIGYSMGSNMALARAARDPRIKAVVAVSGSFPPIPPDPKLPPLLILHGSKDKLTPLDEVKKYQELLKERDLTHAVHVYNGAGHNFDGARFQDVTRRSSAFFDRHLRPNTRKR